MTAAARLMRALTDPEHAEDHRDADLSQVTDEELGSLLVASHRIDVSDPPARRTARAAIVRAAGERQPRYTPDACRRMFEALVEECREHGWADLGAGLDVLRHRTGPLPDLAAPVRTLVDLWLAKDTVRQPYALLAVAGHGGEETLRAAVAHLTRDVGPIVADEIAVAAALTPAERILLSGTDRDNRFLQIPAGAWHRSAGIPAYAAFTRRALEAAADRTDAIRAGEIPYRPDKAFTDREVTSLGQALRVALLRDEPWLPPLLDRLLPGIALAPTAARTLPSQALLYEVARAAQDFPTPELVTALRAARGCVRHAGVPRQLDKMLKKAEAALAERTDVALRLPRLDLDADGVLRRTAGAYEAVVTVTDTAVLTWEKDGRPLRALPAAVRRDHAALVKDLRDLVKRVNAHLATLLRALEGGYTADAVHLYARWRTDLAGHPFARTLVGRLIWEIEVAPGEWTAVLPETSDRLPAAPDDASVRLWHPLRSDPDAVRAWRDLLTEHRVRQPFKQAFREIYRLTPAEEETRDHSHRFAAHLVHYVRMRALFRARGWESRRLGPWGGADDDAADRVLAAGRWRVRFHHVWSDWAGDDELASTDRVCFDRLTGGVWREAPLADVPPLVFSEAMRDVDLFVGVTSIATDPDWTESGPRRAYWERTAFGGLPESALARREALERLLPRLKIADRCTLDGRFLRVRGDLRTYKIHLFSANILMEPDDSYLCVVPARRPADRTLFLPFDDERLALILSKAFLLAADTEITDETILRQLKRAA
ncbi:DUF4132 domain-containing protein [Streptomyces sp. NPDC087512]|uniref:DUF4132 domain-containing protein n=1 Tax=Streptomyces sp. NPDC087512 TaxID=3155059 RepID=UPI003448C533